jgi:hypothetical protein
MLAGHTDSMVRLAINAEIAKHEALIVEIDNKATEELPADQPDEVVAEAPRYYFLRFKGQARSPRRSPVYY